MQGLSIISKRGNTVTILKSNDQDYYYNSLVDALTILSKYKDQRGCAVCGVQRQRVASLMLKCERV